MTDTPTVAGDGMPGPRDTRTQPPLRRSRDHKVISGVCGGLGRFCDLDPVIFRVVLSVLAVAGGLGLIVYGFCWLLVPLHGEEENEGRKLLSGRVEGPGLTAVLVALVGCGLFLSMLNEGSVMYFAIMLSLAASGGAYWSHHRRQAESVGAVDPATAQAVADAPPETLAPPTRGGPGPSWWRDPIVKDGTTGPVGATSGYLWGPADGPDEASAYDRVKDAMADRARRMRERGSIGGRTFVVAVAAGVLGARLMWSGHPLGTSLEVGFAAALGVFGLAMVIGSRYGRTGSGTVLLAVITCGLLAGAAVLPKSVTADWSRRTWAPASAAAVRDGYEVGGGVGELKLHRLSLREGTTVTTRAEVGAGKLAVTVPRDARVELSIHVGLGDIRLPGEGKKDVDIEPNRDRRVTLTPAGGGKPHGTLRLTLEIGLGNVEVTRS
ncbi:PspC domain-containing protein [Streptomyces sp. NPDC048636]|uniref:PspC domain-containing protein n=1 Tax=Streptomyces sp. NPDC048636 TaxID=3155762 RepID=UPI0034161412